MNVLCCDKCRRLPGFRLRPQSKLPRELPPSAAKRVGRMSPGWPVLDLAEMITDFTDDTDKGKELGRRIPSVPSVVQVFGYINRGLPAVLPVRPQPWRRRIPIAVSATVEAAPARPSLSAVAAPAKEDHGQSRPVTVILEAMTAVFHHLPPFSARLAGERNGHGCRTERLGARFRLKIRPAGPRTRRARPTRSPHSVRSDRFRVNPTISGRKKKNCEVPGILSRQNRLASAGKPIESRLSAALL
jgi:hypothetical protein